VAEAVPPAQISLQRARHTERPVAVARSRRPRPRHRPPETAGPRGSRGGTVARARSIPRTWRWRHGVGKQAVDKLVRALTTLR
jgi:hypothetical protein